MKSTLFQSATIHIAEKCLLSDDFDSILNEDPILLPDPDEGQKSQLLELAAGLKAPTQSWSSWNKRMFEGLEPKLVCRSGKSYTTQTEKDADKTVCLGGRLKAESCLVYSFGVDGDFSFENKMVSGTACEIHSFDCMWEYGADSKTSKKIPPSDLTRITFHPWCISSKETLKTTKRPEGEEGRVNSTKDSGMFYRLHEIKKMLGHSGRILDILKIDVEGDEWEVLDDVLPHGAAEVASQLIVELHFGVGCWGKEFRECRPMPTSRVSNVAMRFAAAGYGMFAKALNPRCRLCVEVSYAELSKNAQIATSGLRDAPRLAFTSRSDAGSDAIEQKNCPAASATVSCNLALVIPFIKSEIPNLLTNFKLWDHFVPCNAVFSAPYSTTFSDNNGKDDGQGKVDLIFYSSRDLSISDKNILVNAVTGMSSWRTCFHRYRFISQGLSEANDKYERGTRAIKAIGPNIAFFKLFANEEIHNGELKPDYVLWMEHDMFPIRELWLQNGLLAEIEGRCDPGADTHFWVKGSVHRGPWMEYFSTWNNQQRFFTNGCQLYRYGDPDFDAMLARIINRWPLEHLRAFDTAFRSFLDRAAPQDKGYLQQIVHKFEYTSSIFYYGIELQYGGDRGSISLPTEAHHAYLYHGPRTVIDEVSGLPRWDNDFDPAYARQLDRIRYTNARMLGSETAERKTLTASVKLVQD